MRERHVCIEIAGFVMHTFVRFSLFSISVLAVSELLFALLLLFMPAPAAMKGARADAWFLHRCRSAFGDERAPHAVLLDF